MKKTKKEKKSVSKKRNVSPLFIRVPYDVPRFHPFSNSRGFFWALPPETLPLPGPNDLGPVNPDGVTRSPLNPNKGEGITLKAVDRFLRRFKNWREQVKQASPKRGRPRNNKMHNQAYEIFRPLIAEGIPQKQALKLVRLQSSLVKRALHGLLPDQRATRLSRLREVLIRRLKQDSLNRQNKSISRVRVKSSKSTKISTSNKETTTN